jgi:hypothetical protein
MSQGTNLSLGKCLRFLVTMTCAFAQEHADGELGVPHARLEGLGDPVEQQASPGMLGGYGLEPAVAEEHAQPRVAGHLLED